MLSRSLTVRGALIIAVLMWFAATPGFPGQQFVFKIGGMYEHGDFGTPETTRVFFVPVTFRLVTERYSLSLTPSFARLDTTSGSQLIDGTPVQIRQGADGVQERISGAGDTVFKGRIFLNGGGGLVPAVTPFFKVKIPTGDAAKNLSTGKTDYGFGVELDTQVKAFMLFGDLGYTVMGDLEELDLRNRLSASLGIGKRLSRSDTASVLVDWRNALVHGNQDPVELFGVLSHRINSVASISPNLVVGFSDGSPSFGAGFELAFRLGRLD